MSEKRVYVIPYHMNEPNMSDKKFIEIAESIGWVWSSTEEFVRQWNTPDAMYNFPDREYSELRIIEVECYEKN